MRHFGTVAYFDAATGRGSIRPARTGELIDFQKGAALWQRSFDPVSGQRLSYEVALTDGGARAVKLRNASERTRVRPPSSFGIRRFRSSALNVSADGGAEPFAFHADGRSLCSLALLSGRRSQ